MLNDRMEIIPGEMLKDGAFLYCSFKYPKTSGQIPLLAKRCKIEIIGTTCSRSYTLRERVHIHQCK